MSRAFPQLEMTPVYGLFHYLISLGYGMWFRGEVAGQENLPKDGAFLVAANHASFMDPPFVGCQIPRQLCFFARKTLWKRAWPLGGSMRSARFPWIATAVRT
jgi:1-acyl-sn-glycerol-3-phosphate acyltransferase